MANPQGLTAEAIPAAKANSAVPPIRPPRNSCEFPDSFPSTNRLTGSIPPPLPTAIAPATATASATTATTPVTAQVRPCPSLSADSAAFITLIRPKHASRIYRVYLTTENTEGTEIFNDYFEIPLCPLCSLWLEKGIRVENPRRRQPGELLRVQHFR